MASVDVTWNQPRYSGYSILNTINPAVCWQEPQVHPFFRAFDVEMYREEEDRWVGLGETSKNYIGIETGEFDIFSSYQLRIATIGINRERSAWSYSRRFISSPLRFDFTTNDTVILPDGRTVQNQRLLFLLF
jgi:hypothetical protein